MPKPTKGPRLGGSPAHQRLILSNLATQLFEHGRITTTEAKARRLRPYAEKLITKAKKGDLHNRREVLKTVRDKSVVHVLFTEIAPNFAERPGGYTRITKIGPRKGDNAPMAVIELVTEEYTPAAPATDRAEKSTAKKAAPAPEPADSEATGETEGTDVATTGPTSLEEEASMEESVIAEEQPVADEAEGSDLTVEPAPGSDDPAADAAAEESAGESEAAEAVDEPTDDDDDGKA